MEMKFGQISMDKPLGPCRAFHRSSWHYRGPLHGWLLCCSVFVVVQWHCGTFAEHELGRPFPLNLMPLSKFERPNEPGLQRHTEIEVTKSRHINLICHAI